jgi:hypothetical protein
LNHDQTNFYGTNNYTGAQKTFYANLWFFCLYIMGNFK